MVRQTSLHSLFGDVPCDATAWWIPDAVYRTETAGNYVIEKREVSSSDRLHLRAAPGGGATVSFKLLQ